MTSTARLLPIAVRSAAREVDLVAPGELDWTRPFWQQSVKHLESDETIERTTITFADMRRMVGSERPSPVAMVFHIGRCGSTLLSRMLGHDPNLLVVREASTIGALHRGSAGAAGVPTFDLEQAFLDLLVLHERYARRRGQRLVVKHSSWESFSMGRLAELLPHTPFVFCYRDPVAVVESSLDGHPGWSARLHEPRSELQRWLPWLDRVDSPFKAAEIYAAVWAAGVNAALSLPADRVLLVEYERLVASPTRVLDEVVAHLGVAPDFGRALSELDKYSKGRDDDVEFEAAVTDAHPPLSARTERDVRTLVDDLPERLAERTAVQASRHHP